MRKTTPINSFSQANTHGKPYWVEQGFTLIELMVTVAVLAIMLSIAVPSFQSAIASSSLKGATNDLMVSIAQTRSVASRVNRRATMCTSTNGTQCSTTSEWQQGWIIFIDVTHSGVTASVDTGDSVNSTFPAMPNNIVIKGASGFTQYISYSSDGQGKTNTGATLSGKIRVCSTSPALTNEKRARDLVMSFSGRVVIETPTVIASCPAPT